MRASKKQRVFYLKPVSTGSEQEADEGFVSCYRQADPRFVHRHARSVQTKCLYQYREPMSPHLAAQLAPDLVRAGDCQEYTSDVKR